MRTLVWSIVSLALWAASMYGFALIGWAVGPEGLHFMGAWPFGIMFLWLLVYVAGTTIMVAVLIGLAVFGLVAALDPGSEPTHHEDPHASSRARGW